MSAPANGWPEAPWHEWADTLATLHLWTQIVGKVKLAALGKPDYPWQVGLAVTEHGLTTGLLPFEDRTFAIDLDLIDHRLVLSDAAGDTFTLWLEPMTVAEFYRHVMRGVGELGLDLTIKTHPYEVPDPIPFDVDEVHSSYDRAHVDALLVSLRRAHGGLERFQAGFRGETSPLVFFWGSFDLSTSRLGPAESTCGWWPLDREFGPAWYAYTKPAPVDFSAADVGRLAEWSSRLGEFILPDDALSKSANPDGDVLAFLESTYRAGIESTD